MEISEVTRLADWLEANVGYLSRPFAQLEQTLKNNTQQNALEPVQPKLDEVAQILEAMPTHELSSLQLRALERLGVDGLFGEKGKRWLKQTIQSSVYDPVTTFTTVQDAIRRITSANYLLSEFREASMNAKFDEEYVSPSIGSPYLINVVFQQDASIGNVRDWKVSASDWELIISGVAAVAGEKPEETQVVGASQGSIILKLSATPLVTKILATISKHIASISNDYLDFQLKREELKRSRMMSDAIEQDLARQEKERRDDGKSKILEAVKLLTPNAKPEELSKLEKALKKYISFSEKGGEVDFVAPPELDENSDDYDNDLARTLGEVRDLIEEYQSEKQQTKLLEGPTEE